VLLLLADLGILFLFWRIPGLIRGGEATADPQRRHESTLLCLTYILFTAVFGRIMLQGDDLITGLLLVAAIYFALRNKAVAVDVLLAVGVWFSLGILAWIPLFWCYGMIGRVKASDSNPSGPHSGIIRALLLRIGVLAGGLCLLYLPFLFYSGRPLGQIVQFHLERGTQLESSVASILIMGAKIFGYELSTDFTHHAIHLSGTLAGQGAAVTGILSILVYLVLTLYLIRMLMVQSSQASRGLWLIRGLLATILALLATSKIFLPQYLLWICPLAVIIAHDLKPRTSRIGWYLLVVNLVSAVLFFFFYPNLIELNILPAVLLMVRNAMVIWLVVLLLRPDKSDADQREPIVKISPIAKKYLLYVPVVLLFAWGTIAAFRPIRNADVWMHLRVADDIIAGSEIPRVDRYSAVAAGRAHLTHEWLSALIFRGIYQLGGGKALSVFRAMMMLAMLLLLWFSLEKRARRFVLTAPLLALAAYVILERVFVRPHIFTLLFLCVWVFCIEHWRRERRPRYLVILVPLQILWANLHGGYFIALVLGAMMTGTTALLTVFPFLSKSERFSRSDVFKFAVLTAACLVASLVNPHGLELMKFSLTMSIASGYIKQYVYEWGSPLAAKYRGRAYGFDIVLGLLGLMWLGLILNIKRKPFLDAVFALLATVITVQAIRFVSFIGILGFPLTVRAWQSVADTAAKPLLVKRHPYVETALIATIIASTLIYGFPYDKSNHRRIGWGFGGRLPVKTVEFLRQQEVKGVIYNDYADGAYILHHLVPDIRPVMDSRIDVYGSELTYEYFSSRDDPVKFFRYLNKYDVSFILLMQSEKNIPVIQMLSQLPSSKLLLRADERFLFSYDADLLPAEIRQRLKP
jgi:hypothetical protein